MTRKITFILLCIFAAISCVKEPVTGPQEAEANEKRVSKFSVPIDSALEEMYAIMDAAYGTTRAGVSIKNIETVDGRRLFPATRAGTDSRDIDDVLYIVNFDGDQGFALLAADNRLDPVIAVTEKGSLSAESFYRRDPHPTLTFEDLYCEEDDDYYLGGSGNSIFGMIRNYVDRGLPELEPHKPDSLLPPPPPRDRINIVYGPWQGPHEPNSVTPMLTTKWHQGSPFNDQCPGGIFDPPSYHYPAGCVAIAVAQIMAYHDFPKATMFHSGSSNSVSSWRELREYNFNTYRPTLSDTDLRIANSIATIMHKIGKSIPVIYNFFWSGQTFATPEAARGFLEEAGYENTKRLNGYNWVEIFKMLRASCPVFIGAVSDTVDGHAWVIDGALQNWRWAQRYVNDVLTDTYKGLSQQMVHCNWGWRGFCDGYYVSGIFNLKEGPVETEPCSDDISATQDSHYDHLFQIVTYSKP